MILQHETIRIQLSVSNVFAFKALFYMFLIPLKFVQRFLCLLRHISTSLHLRFKHSEIGKINSAEKFCTKMSSFKTVGGRYLFKTSKQIIKLWKASNISNLFLGLYSFCFYIKDVPFTFCVFKFLGRISCKLKKNAK